MFRSACSSFMSNVLLVAYQEDIAVDIELGKADGEANELVK